MATLKRKWTPEVSCWLRWCLATLLLLAAVLKAHQLFTDRNVSDSLFDRHAIRMLLIASEVGLSLWLISERAARIAGWVSCGVFTIFAVISTEKILHSVDNCGCFGSVPVSPWVSLVLDILCVFIALFLALSAVPATLLQRGAILRRLATSLMTAFVAAVSLTAITDHTQANPRNIQWNTIEPKLWVGKPWPLLQHAELPANMARGKWDVLIFSWSCGHCNRAVERWVQSAKASSHVDPATSFAALEISGDPPPVDAATLERPVIGGPLSLPPSTFLPTPTRLELVDGIVVRVRDDLDPG